MSDESAYSVQRGFTAWIAAIYAFFTMLFGTASILVTILGRPNDAMLMLQAAILIALLIPNFILSSLIWTKVYGNQV